MLTPNYKWGQRGDFIIITAETPFATSKNTTVDFVPEGKLHLRISKEDGACYGLDLQLYGRIVAGDCHWFLKANSLIMNIKILNSEKWPSLQLPNIPKPRSEKPDFDLIEVSDEEDENEDLKEVLRRRRTYEPPLELPKVKPLDEQLFEAVTDYIGYKPDLGDFFVFCMLWISIAICPFTKVEESFNLQAIHDLEFVTPDFDQFDHHEFPGAVPRTFLGALLVAGPLSPIAALVRNSGGSKLPLLILSRMFLGVLSLAALVFFRKQITKRFGAEVGTGFMIITATQFHLVFYMSRTLPNTFAQIFVYVAYGFWFQEKFETTIALLAFTSVVFRSEVAILAIPIIAHGLYKKRVTLMKTIIFGILSSLGSLALTVSVDSFMWGRLTWPEGESFYFNIVEGKNIDWGVMPIYWYFVSALPRLLLFTLPLVPMGIKLDSRMKFITAPAAFYLIVYSFVPHKEARFIFYIIPLLNLASAVSLGWLYRNMEKQRKKLYLACAAVVLSGIVSFAFIIASSHNYPGGRAMQTLHVKEGPKILSDEGPLVMPYVHIDSAAAMTGISRFLEQPAPWSYSKDEKTDQFDRFTHLITERSSVDGFEVIHTIDGLDSSKLWELKTPLSPKIYVHRRSNLAYLDEIRTKKSAQSNDDIHHHDDEF